MELFEILKYVLPALVVFITVYVILKLYFNNEQKRKLLELKNEKDSVISPLRLQAYERMILFLERISPSALILRSNRPGITIPELKRMMTETMRQEFEHNLSQQLYISSTAWEVVRKAKEEYVAAINQIQVDNNNDADISKMVAGILSFDISDENSPLRTSLELLKSEARTHLN